MKPRTDWIDPDEWRKANEWAREEILRCVKVATEAGGGCGASWLVSRIASGIGNPSREFYCLDMDKRRKLAWKQVHRLLKRRLLEQFDKPERKGGSILMHLRTTTVLDQMLYAVDQESA
jgi:hypothetical protein